MKYVIAIVAGTVATGSLLSVAVYYLLGAHPGYFFAKFIAAPVGFACSFILFVVYDSIWPKKSDKK